MTKKIFFPHISGTWKDTSSSYSRKISSVPALVAIYKLSVPDEVEHEGTGFTGLTTILDSLLYRF